MMALEVVELGTIKLEDLTEKLTLVAVATAELRFENSAHQSKSKMTKEIFESGKIWVTRGAGLSVDVKVLFNGSPADENCRLSVLEAAGQRISDAKFWSALCLSAVLDCPSHSSQSVVSIRIIHSTGMLVSPDSQTPIIRPRSLISAKLERINIQCNFAAKPNLKRRKTEPLRASPPDVMLLDQRAKSTLEKEATAGNLGKYLSLQPFFTSNGDFDLSQVPSLGWQDNTQSPGTRGMRGKHFPKHISDVLKRWVAETMETGRPTAYDRAVIVKQIGLPWGKITNSVRHYKVQQQKTQSRNEKEMLLENDSTQDEPLLLDNMDEISDDTEMLLIEDATEFDIFDDMLFDHSSSCDRTSTTALPSPALIADSLSQSSNDHSVPPKPSLKRFSTKSMDYILSRTNIATGDPISIFNLVDITLRTLIGGDVYSQPRRHVLDKKNTLDISLQSICPSLFNLGFQEAMAKNSKYVPTISRSLSTSIFHRAQSPSLKQKLLHLGKDTATTPFLGHRSSAPGESLFENIQSRVWAMMQRTHFDPSRARRLLRTEFESGDSLSEENADIENLLLDEMLIQEAEGDSESEFDDLMDQEDIDDSFLDYLEEAERERLCTERQVEEMLLEHEKETDDEPLLFSDAIEEDSFLV